MLAPGLAILPREATGLRNLPLPKSWWVKWVVPLLMGPRSRLGDPSAGGDGTALNGQKKGLLVSLRDFQFKLQVISLHRNPVPSRFRGEPPNKRDEPGMESML
jgi:hypothetical protein